MEMEIDFKSFYMNVRKQWKDINSKLKAKLEEVGLSSQHVSYLIALSTNKDIKITTIIATNAKTIINLL